MDLKKKTIQKAIALVHAKTGLKIKQRDLGGAQQRDTILTLRREKTAVEYQVVYRKDITNNQILGTTIHTLKSLKTKGIIVANYINPTIAGRLQEMNIPFLDATGNAYINEPPIYIFIIGRKPQNTPMLRHAHPFHAAALKVIFPLLCRPELITKTLRELARCAGVALGTVVNVMEELRVRKHIVVTTDGAPHLVNLKALFQQWVILYPTVLRPKLFLGRYTAPNDGWWNQAPLPPDVLWGGEVAAEKLHHYLKAEIATIYTHEAIAPLLIKNRLKEDLHGKIEILKTFWDKSFQLENRGVAPALLVYTDLLATGDPRNIEAAELIYERELAGHLDKN